MADLYGNIPISGEPGKPEPPAQPAPSPSGPQKPQKEGKSPLKRWYVFTPVLFLLLAAGYYIASSTLMPFFIEKKFPEIFHENTGLDLAVSSSTFNPLDFSIVVRGLTLSSSQKSENPEILTVGNLYVDLDLISLLRHGIVSESLSISDAAFTLIRYPDNSYNISPLFDRIAGEDDAADVMNLAEMPFLYSLNNIAISDSSILFWDMRSEQQHRVENLDMTLPTLANFSYDVGQYLQPRFSAVINGSPVELTGETEMPGTEGEKNPTRMSFALQDVDLPIYADYLPLPLPVEIEQGRVSGSIALSFLPQSSAGRQLKFSYKLQMKEAMLHSHDHALTLVVPQLDIEGSLDPLKSDVTVGNLLLRDPSLKIGRNFSPETIDSLLLSHASSKEENTVPLVSPALRVDLLIADNGSIEIDTDQDPLVFTPVQFSVRNYAIGGDVSAGDSGEQSSFRLSGESADDYSLFTWQGSFEAGMPVGDVEINNLPFALVQRRILPETGGDAEGSTDVRGRLSLRRGDDTPLGYALENGVIGLSKIAIPKGQHPWLQTPSGRMTAVTITEHGADVGNLFLENANIVLQRGNLPAPVKALFADDTAALKGIDLQGSLTLLPADETGLPLRLENIHLQATHLKKENSKKDNLALTADIAGGGKINAKGNLHLSPLSGTLALSFNGLSPAALFPAETTSSIAFSDNLLLSGTGSIDMADRRFKGSLESGEGSITHRRTGYTYGFDKAALAPITTTLDLRECSAERIMLKSISFSGESLQLRAGGASLASYQRNGDDLQVKEVVIADAEISLAAGFSPASLPFVNTGNGSIRIDNVVLNGKVYTGADTDDRTEIVQSFTATISPLSNSLPKKGNFSLELQLAEDGAITADGSLALAPLQTRLDLDLRGVPAQFFAPLAPKGLKASLETKTSGEVVYYHPQKLIAGDLQLDDGRLYSGDGIDLANWDRAILSDFKYTLSPLHLGITKLTLEKPQLVYTNTGNHPLVAIRQALKTALPEANDGNDSISFSRLDIVRTDIHEGKVEYVDERMTPAWQTEIAAFSGFINNFHLSESPEPLRYGISGTIGDGGLAAHGSIVFTGDETVAESVLELKNLPLASLEEQLRQSFALQLDQARADVYSSIGGKDATNRARVSISSLAAADAASPLAMTIALLSDTADTLTEIVPLKNEEEPLYAQIINHFQKLVVKASVSPYLLLPGEYASLRQDNTLVFEPGEAGLSAAAMATLDLFALLVEDHPRLRLVLYPVIDRDADSTALQKRLEKEERERVTEENERLLQRLAERNSESPQPVPTEGGIIEKEIAEEELQAFTPISAEPVVITEAMLTNLGQARMRNATAFLLDKHNVPPENIDGDNDPRIDGSNPQIVIELDHIGTAAQSEPEAPAPEKPASAAPEAILPGDSHRHG